MVNPATDEINARFEAADARVETRLAAIELKMDVQFAELKSEIHRGNADTIKWVAGIVVSVMALGLTIMTFVLNNAVPKAPVLSGAPATPIVIYTQPQPAGTLPPAGPSAPQQK